MFKQHGTAKVTVERKTQKGLLLHNIVIQDMSYVSKYKNLVL